MHLKLEEMFDQFQTARRTNSNNQLVRLDIDVHEHETIQHYTTYTLKERSSSFIAVLHFTITVGAATVSNICTLEVSVKRLIVCSWIVLFYSTNKHYIRISLQIWFYLVDRRFFYQMRCYFVSTRTHNTVKIILQITSSLYPTSHNQVTYIRKKGPGSSMS